MSSARDTPPLDPEVDARDPATGGGDETAPAVAGKGRVLLIEDDPAFNDVIADYLADCGFTVVAVQNGRAGIQEVMGGDFALILCDMSMPTMPGDMFYRAVQRIRPDLCERFIFMTGYRGDASKSDFIQSINGYVLPKPFHLDDLRDSIAFIDVRGTFRSVFEDEASVPGDPGDCPPAPRSAAIAALPKRTPARAPGTSEPVSLAPTPAPDPAPHRPAVAVPEPAPPASPKGRRGRAFLALTVAWVVMLLGLFATLANRYRLVRDRATARSAELREFEREWKGVSAHLAEAESKRRGIEARVNRAKILVAESNVPGLAQALGSVATAATAHADLREVEVRADPEDPVALQLRITGVCTGREPRSTADRFRETLEIYLEQFFAKAGVTTRFERLEEASPSPNESATPRNRQAAFTIMATIGKGGTR